MSGVWSHDERTALMVLFEEYPTLTDAQRGDIFGRIFDASLRATRRRYTPQALADQWRQRNAPGRQSRMWEEIDTPSPDAAQQFRLQTIRQAIQTHAARKTGTNYISRPRNAAIALGAHIPYTSQRGATISSTHQNISQQPAASALQTVPPIQTPPNPQAQPTAASSQPSALETDSLRVPPDEPNPLHMLHRKEVYTYMSLSKTYYYDATKGVGPMSKACPLYQFGGPAVEAYCRRLGRFDILLCDPVACSYCSSPTIDGADENRRAAEAAEWNKDLDVSRSPYKAEGDDRGRPFVHAGRDAPEVRGQREFLPGGEWTRPSTEVTAANVLFDDSRYDPGNRSRPGAMAFRKAVICDPKTCEICKK